MIPSSGCPAWPPDHPRTLPRTGNLTPPPGARPAGGLFLGSAENLVRGQANEAGSDLSRHAESPRAEVVEQPGDKRRLSLALQGGGAFGAFTWGVLDRLLEEDDLELDAVSGASAGAINAGPGDTLGSRLA